MAGDELTVALISDVFFEDDAETRLRARLEEAKAQGAELAVLPEIPCNSWSPATKDARDEDAEAPFPNGPRGRMQSEAAKAVGLGLVGGAIIKDQQTGARRNTALIFDAAGGLIDTYCKLHIPEEPGFWETSHYGAGTRAPQVIDAFPLPFGVQICSDINRPEGSHLLGAQGAAIIIAPRATEEATYDRWRAVFRANALTSAVYVLSVNRPRPEFGVLIAGPSIAVSPADEVLLETVDPVGVVTLKRSVIEKARVDYPGYLPVRADLYANAWTAIAQRSAATSPA